MFHEPNTANYVEGLVSECDRCRCRNTRGMWSCKVEAFVYSVILERKTFVTLMLDICMDCHETIIGPIAHDCYKFNPKIVDVELNAVIAGRGGYYTGKITPYCDKLHIYLVNYIIISDEELKQSMRKKLPVL